LEAEAKNCDLALNLGDTTDTFGVVDIRDLLFANQWVRSIGHAAGKQYVLRGNHDTGDKYGHSSVPPLYADGTTEVVTQLKTGEIPGVGKVVFVPHTTDYEQVYEALEEANPDLILAHTDWLGCRLTPQYVSKTGLEPMKVVETAIDAAIFAGHYHTPLQVGCVNFVGSPQYMNFADYMAPIPRGWIIWDSETGDIERVANPHTYECHTIRAEDKRQLKKAHKKLAEDRPEDKKVKVYVPKRLIPDAIELFEGFLWVGVYPAENDAVGVEFESGVDLKTSPEEAIKAAVTTADPAEFDPDLLTTYGMEAFNIGGKRDAVQETVDL
jgi:hypothetical protein